MATVPTQDRLTLTQPKYGITVGIYPSSNPSFDVELQRGISTSATPSLVAPTSSRFSQIAVLGVINGGARVDYQDGLPQSNQFYWYRARSIRDGWTPSAFTTAVNAQSGIIPASIPGAIPFTGRPINTELRLTTAAVLQIASTAGSTAGFITKTITFSGGQFQSQTSTGKVTRGTSTSGTVTLGAIQCSSVGGQTCVGFIPMPPNAVITQLTGECVRQISPAAAVSLKVYNVSTNGAGRVLLKNFTSFNTGANPSSAMNSTVAPGGYLYGVLTLNAVTNINTAIFRTLKVTYRMRQYHHAY